MAETSADRVRTIVSYALTDNALGLSTQTKDDIRRILKYNSSHAGTTPAGGNDVSGGDDDETDKETSASTTPAGGNDGSGGDDGEDDGSGGMFDKKK
jgi:hypothetical protein